MEENMPKLLSISADAKTVKGEKQGYLTGVMYLAPADLSGFEVCPMASAGCRKACLGWHAGRVNILKKGARTNTIRDSRIAKTRMYFEDRAAFMEQLEKEIAALIRKAKREGLTPVVRLNGSSDIPWERVPVEGAANIMAIFPQVQFYDYTKRANRRDLPANYHLTFSLAEDNMESAAIAQHHGLNVAVVFRTLPESFMQAPVIDGDESDLRFLDPKAERGVIVGLKAKGDARKDTSGFVR
jgi:hypothetical protein